MTSDYVLAVRSRGQRMKFWTLAGEQLDCQVYNGEPLWDGAVFELWSTATTPQALTIANRSYPVINFDRCMTQEQPIMTLNTALFSALCNNPVFAVGTAAKFQFCLEYRTI